MIATSLRIARGTAGRLLAAALAVALGAGFVAVVLLGGALIKRTAYDSLAAPYVGAAVVVTGNGLDVATVRKISAVPGVKAARGRVQAYVEVRNAGRTQYLDVAEQTDVLPGPAVTEGHAPTAAGQVALTRTAAHRLGTGLGKTVSVRSYGSDEPRDTSAVVVGLLPDEALTFGGGTVLATPAQALAWAGPGFPDVLAVASPGTSSGALADRVSAALGSGVRVQTGDQRSREAVTAASGGVNILTGLLLGFAALAMFVSSVVIANTFAVLLASRTRQLALLRCLGATSREVRRGVLAEAALLGLTASVAGTAVAAGLAALALALLSPHVSGLPATLVFSTAAVVVPVVLGTVATVLAAAPAARAATRVSPLAALRPEAAPDLRSRTSRRRVALTAVLLGFGAAGLAGGVALGSQGSTAGIGLAVLGGAVSFLGVLVGAVLLVPRTVAALGALITRLTGTGAARLATANALRNPRRTTTTTAALLIGVTLVSLFTVGAATTQASLDSALDTRYPVDLTVGADLPGPSASAANPVTALPAGVLPAVRGVAGVQQAVPLRTAFVTVGDQTVSVQGAPVDALRAAVANPSALSALAPGTAVAPLSVARALGLTDGSKVRLGALTVTVRTSSLPGTALLLADGDLAAAAPGAAVTQAWVRLAHDADAQTVVSDVNDAVGAVPGAGLVPVQGAAAERAAYQQVIDVLLLVVIGLLAVAVLIALVGVANTLSLSVVERTGESALLRALGLTRGQLRGMLALEGALVAGVGALLGVVLGTLYGWAGAASLLGNVTDGVSLVVPWGRLLLVMAVAVAAGLAASVLPARRAVRTPPVAALG